MSNATSLWIPNSSPLFFYSPAESYFAGRNLNSWVGKDGMNSGSAPQAGDFNVTFPTTSYHSAFGNSAVILPSIYATAFTPVYKASEKYNTTFEIASYGKIPWASGRSWRTSKDDFNLRTLTVWFDCLAEQCTGVDGDEIDFMGAWIDTKFAPDNAQVDVVTLDDSSPIIQYEGFAPPNQENKIAEIDSGADYEQTLSETSTEGAKAKVSFNGGSIAIYGVTCPSCGAYTVNLDGQTATLNSFNNATIHNSLLYFSTNLDTGNTHTLEIEAKGGVVLDKFELRGPTGGVGFIGQNGSATTTIGPSSTSGIDNGDGTSTGGTGSGNGNGNGNGNLPASQSQSGSPNAGVIVGAVLGSIAGLAFLYYLCRKVAPGMKKKTDKKLNPWDEANLLQNMKNEEVHVTTAANQRYVYPGLIAHSSLKK
ncbi:uncharacterized protein I303_101188 [Kwoniella dejecticola CBS 10117]|uniref:Uncharacterized protein n=1 Tax=Kwoniella dejecticola CBS 10117 TaxID=1296121 RepID=A0A1A6AH22_9TREE|nr:uncharacterized protein I303_01194 [Kwoniella dejecticola CBS 10117]OBR89367.1 hypothetical protein I303_01194 [Kwoniella dejecticola CBS 10117]